MSLITRAFTELYPDIPLNFVPTLEYSGQFKGYRGNIRRRGSSIVVRLSKQWQTVSEDIQLGIIQELFVRLFKKKVHTMNMDLYNHFMRAVHEAVPKTKSHPMLQESFQRINRLYFDGLIEQPNLVVKEGLRTLGTYEYGTDTLAITSSLLEKTWLLDYVMFHEALHKALKYKSKAGRHHSHTKDFRKREQAYPNAELLEKELQTFIGGKRRLWEW
ncbi:MAG: hypothetical protein Q7K43_06290 [Candidatus Woesearchaeota archaeon]|nr:hypothetical protein [Candidatus Woesearchaeota archaeon]